MANRILTYETRTEDEGHLVKEILKTKLHLSRREISHAKEYEDGILINGAHVTVLHEIKAGETLTATLHENIETSSEIVPVEGALDIVYEDEDIIVVNKPADVVVHPLRNYYTSSLSNRIAYHFQQNGEQHVIRPVGRLDRETSGLIVFGKNRLAANVLNAESITRQKVKGYLALCDGIFESPKGTVDLPIGDTPNVKMVRMIREDGDAAVTHYEVLVQGTHFALVKLQLETGRTHQIRVHMKAIGHPLLGDHLYSPDLPDWYGMKRVALHSSHMEIIHPVTGERMIFEASLPKDMQETLDFEHKLVL